MRWVCAAVLALAAGSSVLAGAGLAVPPHREAPGTPRSHDHLLAAYRYPLVLMRLRMLGTHAAGPGWTVEEPGQGQVAALVLATLAVAIPRLPRPSRRVLARMGAPALARPRWRHPVAIGPPRPALHATV